MFLLPVLNWQAAVLKAYRRALEDKSFQEELDRRLARVLLDAYLEYSRSKHEGPGQFATMQADLINDYLRILESVLRSFEKR